MPWRICANSFGGSRPTRSVRKVRSRAMICEALATESLGRPAVLAGINVFPARRPRPDCWSTARRRPWRYGSGSVDCPERRPPVDAIRGQTGGLRNSAHQTSPCRTFYHSARSNVRRAATASNGSGRGSPSRSTTRFIASVTSSGACRARVFGQGFGIELAADFRRPLRLSLRGEKDVIGRRSPFSYKSMTTMTPLHNDLLTSRLVRTPTRDQSFHRSEKNRWGHHYPKTAEVAAVAGTEAAADGAARAPRTVVERAAPQHPAAGGRWSSRPWRSVPSGGRDSRQPDCASIPDVAAHLLAAIRAGTTRKTTTVVVV